MAPSIANFHHIEIDNIGKRRRNLQPPGGESSDIFNFRKPTVVTQPRKVKFHNRSNIFTRESAPVISTRLPVLSINTKQRLFGPPDQVPRKAVDRMKSSIFSTDPEPPQPKPQIISVKPATDTAGPTLGTNALLRPDRRNPITGEECAIIKHVKRHQIQKKKSNPITGEGYESPDEDGSTLRSSSSSRSSRSDTPYKETLSAQSNSSRSHTYRRESISARPSTSNSHTYDKEEISDESNKALMLYNKL